MANTMVHPGFPLAAEGDRVATLIAGFDGTNSQVFKTDSTGAIVLASVVPGTAATNLGKAEDAAHTSGDVGVMALGVRNDNLASRAATDGDYVPIALDSVGRIVVSGQTGNDNPVTSLPLLVGGRASTAAPSAVSADGDAVWAWLDRNGRQVVTLGELIAGEDLTNNRLLVMPNYSYAHIAAGQATTVVKASAGVLHSITFNGAATATNVTTVYDNATGAGTVIAIPAATTVTIPVTLTYDVAFANGLTIITATANGADMTVAYK